MAEALFTSGGVIKVGGVVDVGRSRSVDSAAKVVQAVYEYVDKRLIIHEWLRFSP